jgi:hypothetical protein
VSDSDRRIVLALAEAFDESDHRVGLAEAALTAYGRGTPIFDIGLRKAYRTELSASAANRLANLLKIGSRKARAALRSTGYPETAAHAVAAATGTRLTVDKPASMAEDFGLLPALLDRGLLLANPHNPESRAQPSSVLAKLYEGPIQLAVLEGLAGSVSRSQLDRCRDLAQRFVPWIDSAQGNILDNRSSGYKAALFAIEFVALEHTYGPELLKVFAARLPTEAPKLRKMIRPAK